jgi:hypothetical protein
MNIPQVRLVRPRPWFNELAAGNSTRAKLWPRACIELRELHPLWLLVTASGHLGAGTKPAGRLTDKRALDCLSMHTSMVQCEVPAPVV